MAVALVVVASLTAGCNRDDGRALPPAAPTTSTLAFTTSTTIAAATALTPTTVANDPVIAPPPSEAPATSAAAAGRRPIEGFGEIAFAIVSAAGDTARFCALLADTDARRVKGLMGRRDLSGYDGMLFTFDEDTTAKFHMKDTPMPLSIGWFAAEGEFVSSTDMDPCTEGDDCPTYGSFGPYRYALEVPQGRLPALGVGPGSRLSVGASPCPA